MTERQNPISNEEFEDWINSPVTKQYFSKLLDEANIRRAIAAQGGFRKQTSYETGEAYEKAIIQAEVYEACTRVQFEDLTEDD